MASYLSTQVSNKAVEVIGQAPTHQVETFSVTFSANTFVISDTITLAQIPLNCTVLDFYIATSAALGSTAAFNIGTTTSPSQFNTAVSFSASVNAYSNALSGVVANALPSTRFTTQTVATLPAGLFLNPSGNVADFLVMTASAAGGAATSATLKGYIRYTLNTAS